MSEQSCKDVSQNPGKRETEGDNNESPKAKRPSTGDWQKQSQKVITPTDGDVSISFNHPLDEISIENETSSCSSASPKSHFYKVLRFLKFLSGYCLATFGLVNAIRFIFCITLRDFQTYFKDIASFLLASLAATFFSFYYIV